MKFKKNQIRWRIVYLLLILACLNSWAKVKIALWGDSRENEANACEDIADILLHQITDWDFQLHTGDFTPGGSESHWQKALAYKGIDSIFVQDKFFMCTSNHDDNQITYDKYTAGVLPTNAANSTTHFYHHQQENVHIIACDAYFTPANVMQSWLDSLLATIPADDWIIGFWHDPCYADLTYKSSYMHKCRPWLESIYHYNGDFIFHGHAHVYVRTHPLLPDETVDYETGMVHIVNGCGGASFKSEQPHTEHTAFTPYEPSFACITFITIDRDTALVQTIDARPGKNLEIFDEFEWVRGPRFALNVSTQGSGSVTVDPSYDTFIEGSIVMMTAFPDLGWVFSRWSGDFTGSENPKNITSVDSDMNVTAVFNELAAGQRELRVTTSGMGTVKIDPPGGIYAEGTIVTLTAEPDSGWVLGYWGGGLSGSTSPGTVAMDSHKNVSATFRLAKNYNLNINIIGYGDVILNPAGDTYVEGTTVTLTATPASGWIFDNWGGNLSGSNNPESITMNSNKGITVNFIVEHGVSINLTPTDDSYVRGGNYADLNFNKAAFLRINQGDEGKNHRHTYLKFDLSNVNGSIIYSLLKLTVKENGLKGGTPVRVDVYSVAEDNWKETEITWNNAPAGIAHLDSVIDITSEGTIYTWDVTDFVSSEISSDKIVSLMLQDDGEKDMQVDFCNRDNSSPPLLTIVQDTSKVAVFREKTSAPKGYRLYQNSPNPFNPVTRIRFQIPIAGHTKLAIYDIRGRIVSNLVDEFRDQGSYVCVWYALDSNGNQLPSGVYFCRIQAGSFVKTLKMVLML